MNINEQMNNTPTGAGFFQSTGTGAQLTNDTSYQNNGYDYTAAPSFKGELDKLIDINTSDMENYDIEDILKDMDLAENVNIDTLKMDKNDAVFIVNMINQGFGDYSINKEGTITDTVSLKTIEVSKTLNNLLLKANETKKAIRLDFDNNVTVILKVGTEGKINAHFIPGDKAVEEYLKNNIPYLKQRFDELNINYANVNYKAYKDPNQNNKQNNDKGEKNE